MLAEASPPQPSSHSWTSGMPTTTPDAHSSLPLWWLWERATASSTCRTSTLLSSTRAAAVVNGHVSPQVQCSAGVRQGCPLSPSLYLFVAAALQCWLKECPSVGVEVTPDHVVHATQYADDTKPLLWSLDTYVVQLFLGHMDMPILTSVNHHLTIWACQSSQSQSKARVKPE